LNKGVVTHIRRGIVLLLKFLQIKGGVANEKFKTRTGICRK